MKLLNFHQWTPHGRNRSYLFKVIEAAIDAGATIINIPDTVGYAMPSDFGKLVAEIFVNVANVGDTVISVHCHNDLGLAVANSLEAIKNGARQVECTVNGLGGARRKYFVGRDCDGNSNA